MDQATPPTDPFKNDPDALFTETEAAHLLGVSPRTLERWRREFTGPVSLVMGRRFVRYRRRRIVEWQEMHERLGGPLAYIAFLEADIASLKVRLAEKEAG